MSCAPGTNAPPDLPRSVAPAWSRKTLVKASGDCWNAEYTSSGSAAVAVCKYSSGAVALDAVQKSRAEANAVKFQEGSYFVTVKWNQVSQTEITALVRAIQRALHTN